MAGICQGLFEFQLSQVKSRLDDEEANQLSDILYKNVRRNSERFLHYLNHGDDAGS